jgi:hypothetical protein
MCLTCGCMLPHDDHGNPDYLTIEDLEKGAKADSMSLDEAVSNLVKTVEIAKQETEHKHLSCHSDSSVARTIAAMTVSVGRSAEWR